MRMRSEIEIQEKLNALFALIEEKGEWFHADDPRGAYLDVLQWCLGKKPRF